MRALVKLEQVLPAHLRRRVRALGCGHDRARRPAARRRPAGPDADRLGLPRPRAPPLRLPRAATAPRPAARPSPTRSSTSAAAGTWSRGTARARTGARSASTGSRGPPRPACASPPRELPAKDAAAYVAESIVGAPHRYEARVTLHVPPPSCAGESRLRGTDRADRRPTAASSAPATTTSTGSRCGSRCSASTSRFTSRPS